MWLTPNKTARILPPSDVNVVKMRTGHKSRSAFWASLTFSLVTLAAQQFWRLYTCQIGPSRRGEAGLQGVLEKREVARRHLEPPKQRQCSATKHWPHSRRGSLLALKTYGQGKEEMHTQQHSPMHAQPLDEAIARLFLCLDLPLLLGIWLGSKSKPRRELAHARTTILEAERLKQQYRHLRTRQ